MSEPAIDDLLRELKRQARAIWASGNYEAVAEGVRQVAEVVVDRLRIRDGERVIDVACGTGNAAVRAAAHGALVVGLDLTPEMFSAARRRAAEAGVEVEWVEGDAEALPFRDASFDVVVSTFGVMFAPRQDVAAAELVRVLRPGGRIGLAAWTPSGSVGELLAILDRHLPPPRELARSPLLWGVENHVRTLFGGARLDFAFERRRIALDPEIDVRRATEFYVTSFGPIVHARATLAAQGRWDALREELGPAIERMLTEPGEYLVAIGTKA